MSALALARVLTGVDPRTVRRAAPAPTRPRRDGLEDAARAPRPHHAAHREPSAGSRSPPSARWRSVLAGPLVALVTVLVGLVATDAADVPFRDPDHVAALYLALVGSAWRCSWRSTSRSARSPHAGRPPSRAAMRAVRRERWTPARMVAVGVALVSFYVTYMAYRNLKAIVPLLRPDAVFDRQLADLDRALFAGHDPAALLHIVLGVGISTHVLSTAYAAFIVFLPLSLARRARLLAGPPGRPLLRDRALDQLGARRGQLLPAAVARPDLLRAGRLRAAPHSEVTRLQDMLLDQRVAFLAHPATATPQSIAAFASLHISMSLTAALAAHLFGLGRRLKIALWVWWR